MLDTLDQISWDQLSHAYGKATDVPGLLRALASDQKDVWENALYQFYGNIWHQGTVYQATAYVVPFLIELLNAPSVACKAGILALLQALASGSSYLNVHQGLDWYHNERQAQGFQAEMRRELDWVRAAHVAVIEGTPVYLGLLSHSDVSVRKMAPYVLGTCAERVEEIEPALLRRKVTESAPEVKASLLLALAQLWRGKPRPESTQPARAVEQQSYLATIFRSPAESPVVRFVAALSAVQLGGEKVMGEALPVFRETVDRCREVFSQLPWIQGGSPLTAVSGALSPHPPLRLQWLLEMLGRRDPELRKDAVWEIGEMCRQQRSTPPAVVPHLVKLVADSDPEVRQQAAQALPELGKARHLAIDTLQAFQDYPDPEVRALATETLAKVREDRDKYNLKHWFRESKLEKDVAGLIAILEGKGGSGNQYNQHDCLEAIRALELMGPAAREAVPALRQALRHEYQWVRVHAARALWKITQNPDEVLPVLLEELRCRPAGLLVADCLGEMGHRAQAAIPALRRIIDSEVRLVEIGAYDDWVDQDEGFCEAAKQALARIEADLAGTP
jgi:HEAT repeat protein